MLKHMQVGVFVFIAAITLAAQPPVYQARRFTVYHDRIVEGSYEAHALSATSMRSTFERDAGEPSVWTLQSDIGAYPELHSSLPILDSVYNLSLDELSKDVRPDKTFMAGAEWNGVWTRDISYSIMLSLAIVAPDIAKNSLIAKVSHGEIVQDTGTGGSWPVSSDRMVWALAAWEIYQVTGDHDWLKQSYEIVRRSAQHDSDTVLTADNGLVRGESSFMDWREQTYPRWMDAVDIYQSQSLSNNAVHFQTYRILARMARAMGEDGSSYEQLAERIKQAMNLLLWMPSQGYYGEYLYGREHMALSPRMESLGESLSILFDIASAEQQKEMLVKLPLLDYGTPTVFPQTPGIPPYHNESVWPFVQAFWNLAAAKNRSDRLVAHGLSTMLRHTALFLTNKENLVASTGSPHGTEINSDRQLWSVAGSLAMVYRVLFGLNFHEDGIHLSPIIPTGFDGQYRLENLHYRQAVLSLSVRGSGTDIRAQLLDGNSFDGVIRPSLHGAHTIEIVLGARDADRMTSPRFSENNVAPDTPEVHFVDGKLIWKPIAGANTYQIYRDGQLWRSVQGTALALSAEQSLARHEYQVMASDRNGITSFLSAPVTADPLAQVFSARFDKLGTSRTLTRESLPVSTSIVIPEDGKYVLEIYYANGSGPKNTDNQCALRSVYIDGKFSGVAIMPQRGLGAWEDWGLSSRITEHLAAGKHSIELRMEKNDNNMNFQKNDVRVDHVKIHWTVN